MSSYVLIKRTEYENRGNAPIYIDTSEILRDPSSGGTVIKLKLYNNCSRVIKSVYFNAGCFDKNLNLCVQLKNIPYINVDAEPNTEFGYGQPVEVPNITRSIFIEVSRVLFEDGTSWVNPKQELSEDIVSEGALGEDWLRLRLTKSIKDASTAEELDKLDRIEKKAKAAQRRKRCLITALCVAGVLVIVLCAFLTQRHVSARHSRYETAMGYYVNGDYINAAPELTSLTDDYYYSSGTECEINYCAAVSYMKLSDYKNALKYFFKCGDYKNSVTNMRSILGSYNRLIGAGFSHTAVVQKNGTVLSFGDNTYGQCETEEWLGIIGISASGNHTVGMTYDGYLAACGNNEYGQCDVSGWTDIVSVATGEWHTVGLKASGRVIARGNNQYGQCDVQEWSDIVQVAVSSNHTIGLKSDGTAVAVGWNDYGQLDLENEKDILYIATGERNTVLIKYDGSVVVLGDNSYDQCDTSGIKETVCAAVGPQYIVFLDVDGKAKATGLNDKNRASVTLWSNIAAVTCGTSHTVGLCYDGTVSAVGDDSDGKLDLSIVRNIGAENILLYE